MPERLSPRAHGLLAINIAAVIFGTAALYGKLEVAPVWITAMRAGFGVLALLVLGGLSRSLLRLPVQAWGLLGISGALLACHWLTFFISVQLSGVAVGTLTFATFPLFTVTVEAAARRRLPGLTELLAAIAIILAVALLLQPDSSGNDSLAGTLVGLVSALAYAFFLAGYPAHTAAITSRQPVPDPKRRRLFVIAARPVLRCPGPGRRQKLARTKRTRHHQYCGAAVALPVCTATHFGQQLQRLYCAGAGLCHQLCRPAVW